MKISYKFINGEVSEIDIPDEFGVIYGEFERLERNSNAVEHRHCVSLELFQFKDGVMIQLETPQTNLEHKELAISVSEVMACLSRTQARRLLLYSEGYSMHKIAEIENVAYNAVYKSIISAKKLFSAYFRKMGGQNTDFEPIK